MGRADIATLPRLTPGVRLCLHPRALVGSAYDGHRHVGTPETCVAPRRNVMRPLRDARASREAISLRTLLRAQSLRGHNGTAGPPPNLRWTIFGGIRDVRLTSPVSSDADKASHPRVPDRTYLFQSDVGIRIRDVFVFAARGDEARHPLCRLRLRPRRMP